MKQQKCFVCGEDGSNRLGIRLRRADTSALWAPELNAYLCDRHARSGAEIELRYQGTNTGEIKSVVIHDGVVVSTRLHKIGTATSPLYS